MQENWSDSCHVGILYFWRQSWPAILTISRSPALTLRSGRLCQWHHFVSDVTDRSLSVMSLTELCQWCHWPNFVSDINFPQILSMTTQVIWSSFLQQWKALIPTLVIMVRFEIAAKRAELRVRSCLVQLVWHSCTQTAKLSFNAIEDLLLVTQCGPRRGPFYVLDVAWCNLTSEHLQKIWPETWANHFQNWASPVVQLSFLPW